MTDTPTIGRSRRALSRAAGLAGVSLMTAALVAWAPAPATAWNQSSAEATLWQLLNGARVNNGVRALQQNATLVSLARWRSKDQVERDYFSHTILGTNYQVYHWYDLNGLKYSWGGENIGWNNGYSDADSPIKIHEGFMNSPGHRANILQPSFTHGGVGAYGIDNVTFLGKLRNPRFYTELFMQAAGSAPPPPPPSAPNPPPSGGGGSSRPAATATPTPSRLQVDAPVAPSASAPLDGASVVAVPRDEAAPAAIRAMTFGGSDAPSTPATPPAVASSLRVDAPAAPERGIFETVLGSLLGFFL